MKKFEIILIAVSFIITGGLFFGNKYFNLQIEIFQIASVLLMVNSLIIAFNSLQNSNRRMLVWSTFLFLSGVLIFTILKFRIISLAPIMVPSIFFIVSGIFLMLFIENTKNKWFLFLSFASVCCLLFFVEFKSSLLVNTINQYIAVILNYKGVLLFVVGWLLISSRKRIKNKNI